MKGKYNKLICEERYSIITIAMIIVLWTFFGKLGLNENANGLIRQYLKKGDSLKERTLEKGKHIEEKSNVCPRKTLKLCRSCRILSQISCLINLKKTISMFLSLLYVNVHLTHTNNTKDNHRSLASCTC